MMRGAVLLVAVGLAAVGLAGGGCAWPGTAADAGKVDMCTILSNSELTRLGLRPDTRETVDQFGSVGCEWAGKPFRLSLERDKETVASYRSRERGPAFITYTENVVNGRAGVTFEVDRDGGTDCEQLIDGGSVSLVVHVAAESGLPGPQINSCAEALRIAHLIEPRLPKARR